MNTTTLSGLEPSLTFTTGTIGGFAANVQGSVISMYTSSDGNGVVLTAFSKSGNCWIVADNTPDHHKQSDSQPDHVRGCHGRRYRAARCRYAVRQGCRHYRCCLRIRSGIDRRLISDLWLSQLSLRQY